MQSRSTSFRSACVKSFSSPSRANRDACTRGLRTERMVMLLYKSWRESRVRFLLSAVALAVICASFVFFRVDASSGIGDEPLSYPVYIWRNTYKGYLRELFMILTILLGLGGLARERDHRTVGFTLALPVSRWRLLATRTFVGLAQVVLLAAVPAVVLPVVSPLSG